jgi:hypothetical protein
MTFSADAEHAQAIHAWYPDCMADTTILAFRKTFDKAQKALLQWAGVGEMKGVALH